MTAARPRLSGHFVAGEFGPLAVVLWQPPPGIASRFAVLHVPAAGDELNKSRRMIAMQARKFACRGGTVAIVDLRGTGDSGGEHREATWIGWRADVTTVWAWLAAMVGSTPIALWGLRLGGLLAAELANTRMLSPDALLLWQPVASGRVFFNQWLRVVSTQQITGRRGASRDLQSLRTMVATGAHVEVSGYELHPDLIMGAEAVNLAELPPPQCPIVCLETTVADPPVLSPSTLNIRQRWSTQDQTVDFSAVRGPSFWASQELAEAPELIERTTISLFDRPSLREKDR